MEEWIIVNREISVAHKLECHEGKCRNLHGHTYKLKICLAPPRESNLLQFKTCPTMIMDFASLNAFISRVLDEYDHSYLNERLAEPTCESFARLLFHKIAALGFQIRYLELYESGKNGILLEP
jgi:6-pyruvoyltetrahydropterin/6-carboxytetrahydropterin synthase